MIFYIPSVLYKMKKNCLFFSLLLLSNILLFSQNVGIGSATPVTKLDVNGDFALRTFNQSIANGLNHNLDLSTNKFSYYRLTGATATYTVTGIAGGVEGRWVTIQNASNQTLIVANANAGSLAGNQILTAWNSDLLISPNGSVTLHYNKTDSKWIANSWNSSQQGSWSLQGNSGTNPALNFIGTIDNQMVKFKTNNTEHLRMTAAGRFGFNSVSPMGTYYPYHRIEIQDSTGLNSDIIIRTASVGSNGVPAWVSMKSNGSLQTPAIVVQNDYLSEQYYMGYDGANFLLAAKIDAFVDGTPGLWDMPGRLSFFTTQDGFAFPFERMRIANNGDIRWANLQAYLRNDQGGSLELGGNDLIAGVGMPYIDFHYQAAVNNYNARMQTTGTNKLEVLFADGIGEFKVNGIVTASCGTLICSDKRFKKDIVELDNATSLRKLLQLNAYFYYFDTQKFPQNGFSNEKQVGLLAQEVEILFPELVKTGNDGYKMVDYSKLSPILLSGMKAQNTRLEALEKENEELKARLQRLEKRLEMREK
jgi:hypothetical protein